MTKIVWICILLSCSATCRADTLAHDGNGAFVGFYTGILEHGGVVLVSGKGFRFVVVRDSGLLRGPDDDASETVYFESGNCTGAAHLGYHNAQYDGVVIPLRGGVDFSVQAVYYTPQNAVTQFVQLNSRFDYSGPSGSPTCTPISSTQGVPSIPLLPNDPGVTGVPNTDLVPPITISSNQIFRTGFDAALLRGWSVSAFA
jgi:hypothetical protein